MVGRVRTGIAASASVPRTGPCRRCISTGERVVARSHTCARAAAGLLAGLAAGLALAAGVTSPAAAQTGTVAFLGATVIPMDGERVLQDHTVVVTDGRITALGPAVTTTVPAGATRVDARGKFLIPGLAEMHAHIPGTNNQYGAQWTEDVLFLYVAAGATTIRGMQGHPSQIELRRRVNARELIGPRMWLAGPQLAGNVPDAAAAERIVREQKAAGFDLLKIQEGLSLDAYRAAVRTARELNMPFGGHVPAAVTVPGALEARQNTIDHLDDYIVAAQRDGAVMTSPRNADPAKIPALARATREAGVAVVPTMALWETLRGAHDAESLRRRPELRFVPRQMVQGWTNSVNNARAATSPEDARAEVAFRNQMLKGLSDAGVTILMGTDAPQIFSVPGFSLFHEVRVMRGAGMTPHQILVSGTSAVARYFGVDGEAGTIGVGKRADLILLDESPLQDITNIEKRAGVMVNGRWLSRTEIDRRLGEIATRYAGG